MGNVTHPPSLHILVNLNTLMFCVSGSLLKEEQGTIWTCWGTEMVSEEPELGGRGAFQNKCPCKLAEGLLGLWTLVGYSGALAHLI